MIWVIVGRRILDRIGQEQTDNVSKGANMSIYAVIRLVGTSLSSWEDAAKGALEEAAKHLEDLRVAEVEQLDIRSREKRRRISSTPSNIIPLSSGKAPRDCMGLSVSRLIEPGLGGLK